MHLYVDFFAANSCCYFAPTHLPTNLFYENGPQNTSFPREISLGNFRGQCRVWLAKQLRRRRLLLCVLHTGTAPAFAVYFHVHGS